MKYIQLISSYSLPHKSSKVIALCSLSWGICSLPLAALGAPFQIAQSDATNLLPLQNAIGVPTQTSQSDATNLLPVQETIGVSDQTAAQSDATNLLPLQGIETDPSQPAVEPEDIEPYNFFQPSSPPVEEDSLDRIGLLKNVSANELTIRSLDGNEETFPLSSQLASLPPLSPGDLVSFRLEQSQVAEVEIPVVKTMFEGSLVVIEKDVLGLVSAAGERKYARLSPEKISSLDIEPGQTIQVIEFEGIKTKVVCAPQSDKRVPLFVGGLNDGIQNF